MIKYFNRIKYIHFQDIIHIFLFLIALPCSFFFRLLHKDLWIISDDGNDARDNGFWLFKYICEEHSEIDCVYALMKKSPDNERVKKLGKVISYGTLTHWIYYLASNKAISSQKGGNPNSALCYFLFVSGLLKKKRIFLQHGITKDDIPSFYYEICKFSLFVTAVPKETDFIEKKFGYDGKGIVKMLGLCRFDNLQNFRSVYKANQILLMPTWRDWIAKPVLNSYNYDDISEFKKTEYYLTYQNLINNKLLQKKLSDSNCKLVFYPHKHMQKYISDFKTDSPNIIIANWHEYEVQPLLMESALLITDYSSVAMDFAYMSKPVLYYQFDEQKVRAGHYKQGYFSYKDNGFGEVCIDEKSLINLICNYIDSGFSIKDIYQKRINDFFTIHDDKNCQRNFNAIKDL